MKSGEILNSSIETKNFGVEGIEQIQKGKCGKNKEVYQKLVRDCSYKHGPIIDQLKKNSPNL